METTCNLPESQYGFRKQRSCIDNLSILYSDIVNSFKNKKASVAAFLDIQGAFDNVLSDILIDKLKSLGHSPNVIALVHNLTSARQLFFRFGDLEVSRRAYKGLPQSNVLSPILYNLYVADIQNCCAPSSSLIQYADDICIFSSMSPTLEALQSVESSVNICNSALSDLGLDLSEEKTKLCVFSHKDKELYKVENVNGINRKRKISLSIQSAPLKFNVSNRSNFLVSHSNRIYLGELTS